MELFEKGRAHFDNQNYKRAFDYFIKSYEAGYVGSKTYIGIMYYDGIGIKKDYNMALRWYTLAGEVGEPISQYMAGVICYYGMVGSVPDYEQALGWFQKSAKNGNPNVYVCLGRMYFEGKGTVKNYNIALNWLKRASDEGESFSSFIIGQTYSFGGYCVDRDFDLTEIWFMKGANNEDPNSICGMEVLYGIRGDSKRNRDKNFEWCTKAARYNFGIVLNTVTLHFLIVNARKVFVMTT